LTRRRRAVRTEGPSLALLCLLPAWLWLAGCAPVYGQDKPVPLPPLPIEEEAGGETPKEPPAPPEAADPTPTPEAVVEPPEAAAGTGPAEEKVGEAAAGETVEEPPPSGPVPVPERRFACEEHFPGEPPKELGKKIDAVLKDKDLEGAKVSVLAVAYPEGTVLYRRDANLAVNPASVTKLFTAATALSVLGEARRYATSVVAGKGECPPLHLVGGGDPGLFSADVDKLAEGVKAKGTSCVERVYYDVSLFDDRILAPHYEEKQSDAHWRPKIGALGMSDGALDVRIYPGDYPDAAPRVTVDPSSSCVLVDSRALTVDVVEEGKHLTVSVDGSGDKVVVHVTGQVPMKRKGGVLVRKAIPHPDLFTACYFRDALKGRGVKIKEKALAAGRAPRDGETLASIASNSVGTDLKRMQRWSKNFVAEQFVKLHGEGRCTPLSFECGLRTMRQALARFHLNHRCLRLENGSGLFDANRVTAAQVVRLLLEVANHKDWGPLYREALPLGAKSGTLKERMKKVKRPVRAKTGTLDYHSSLAGYIERRNGGYIAFAILFADAKTTAYRMRRIQDRVVEILATWK
jgi:D-alanyl-D-alanine carboxypeptidase/D-alanyl-D-alanine-endopeptidase (penicillin-binding protein 4)